MERTFKITVDGRPYIVTVEEITEHESRTLPEPGSMQVPQAVTAAPVLSPTPAASAGPGDEVSPLAGIVHAIEVSVGQAVQQGDKIAAIEAMKMTTTVVAHHSGTVTRIDVKPGDPVDAGQVLLNIG